jgi:hypothetical protein
MDDMTNSSTSAPVQPPASTVTLLVPGATGRGRRRSTNRRARAERAPARALRPARPAARDRSGAFLAELLSLAAVLAARGVTWAGRRGHRPAATVAAADGNNQHTWSGRRRCWSTPAG